MSLTSLLPAPKHTASTSSSASSAPPVPVAASSLLLLIPKYGTPARLAWRPSGPDSFADGGALPEVHILQYPLNMGSKQHDTLERAVVQLQVDAAGETRYDAVLRQDTRHDMVVYARPQDLVPKKLTEEELERPSEQDVQKTIEATRLALEKETNLKVSAVQPRTRADEASKESDVTYFKYKPADSESMGITERIVQVREAAIDPLEPSKFKHKKAPVRPPSPPVPIMHSPTRKVPHEELEQWKNLPSCTSQWKNVRSFTVSLEQRAADGRNLIEPELNAKHAEFADSLYIAERNARKALEEKAQLRKEVALQQKEQREIELRELARQAKEQRNGLVQQESASSESEVSEDEIEEREQRDQLREEMKRERRRDYRMSQRGTKRSKRERELERDISERVALGQGPPPMAAKGDAVFDHRLFNKEKGIGVGFGADDSYSVYDKPLFGTAGSQRLYRPSAVDTDTYGGGDDDVKSLLEKSAGKFRPDKGFSGSSEKDSAESRTGPVQFEKQQADPFGLEKFLTAAKEGKSLDKIGSSGFMAAAGGGGSVPSDDFSSSGSKRKMEFVESSKSSSRRDRSRSRSRSRSRDRRRR